MRGRVTGGDGEPTEVGGLADELLGPADPGRRRPTNVLRPTLLGALIIGSIAWGAAQLAVDQRRAELAEGERLQAKTLAEANAALISGRVAGLSQLARRITGSELVQVYAASAAGPGEVDGWLADQAPFLVQMFEDFVSQHQLVAASLVTASGDVVLAAGELVDVPTLPERAGNGIDPTVTPLYELVREGSAARSMAFDIVLPIPGLAEPVDRSSASALLVVTLDAASTLRGAVGAREDGVLPVLTQEVGQDLRIPLGNATLPADTPIVTQNVAGTPWLLEQPIVPLLTEARLAAYERHVLMGAATSALLLALAFGIFCRALARRRRRDEDQTAQAAADQAERFGELFRGLADKMSDGVGLKSADGRYVYVNDALCRRLGRTPEEIVGRTDLELAGGVARGAGAGVSQAPLEAQPLVRFEGPQLVVVGRPASRTGEPDAGSRTARLPAARDGQLTVNQAVDLLVRAVELRDPFLRGHAERLAELSGAVAARMGLGAGERATIDLAARLSQIGKIFIPDSILTKPGRHTEEETRIMRSHVLRAQDLLERVDLGLPVAFVLSQIHERLDGSGYPHGLSGEDIVLPARILGAVDVFCARTAPRAYRDQITAGQALFHLAGHPERFDARVVTALVAVFAELREQAPAALAPPDRADAA